MTVGELADGLMLGQDGLVRCWWPGSDELYVAYHDDEWGRPVGDERRLFEKLCLEGFQAGLSWLTILRKREHFRAAFDRWDPERIAGYGDDDVARLMADAGIVRNRAKIDATITNARRYLELVEGGDTLARLLWSFEPGPAERPARVDYPSLLALATTPASRAMSRELRRRGWAFVGPTTCYAAMEAMGIVDDHLEGCHARPAVERERAAFTRPSRA